MRYDTLAPDEAAFKTRGDYTFTPFSVEVQDENLVLKGKLCKPKNRSGYYNTPEPPPAKERIVLHFTAGNLSGGIDSLTRNNTRISVPFVIARDGTIYQLFPSKYWSGNLGKAVGNTGTNNAQDKATIGIEIINYGYLVKRGDTLETIYSDPAKGKLDQYCKLSQTDAYQKLPEPFRNQDFYASYTPEQYDSLIILLRFLTKKYNIPRTFQDEAKRYETSNDVLSFKGIVSHVNYRGKNQFGGFEKWDIGPAFDWKTVINGVKADEYVPAFAERSLVANDDVVTSDEQIEAFLDAPRGLEVAPPDEDLNTDPEGNAADNGETKPRKKLYALLVGIDKYESFPLHGCVNDMNAMEEYLSKKTDFEHQILTIQDSVASKSAVINAFREHLGKATSNDTVFFYFSGHGTQENADPIWKNETDEGLECFVCYNGNTQKTADFLLADKEIRYLLHEVSQKTGAHIAVMFDCCHSGDNTRSLAAEVFRGKDTFVRRVYDRGDDFFPQRDWADFIFSDKVDYEAVKDKNLADFLPEGTYVQLAACESDEVALEVGGRGVFTSNFLQVLEKAGGDISYQSLRSRVRQYMKFGFDQKPKISVVGNSGLLNAIFLNQRADHRKSAGEMVFNETKNAWLLNLGAMHGAKEGMEVQIVDPDNAAMTTPASIGEVFIDHAVVDTKDSVLKKEEVYKVLTDNMMVEEVQLFLNNVDGNQSELNPLVKKLLADSGGYYVFVENEAEADFTLHVQTGQCFVTRAKDPFRPLFLPVDLDDDNKEFLITNALRTISRWQFVQKLENKGENSVNIDLLKIELSQVKADGSETGLEITDQIGKPVYEKTADGWKGKLKIKVTNQSDRKL
ncbi:caspase family protein [Dyadobacter sp. NIV53]|uniref:caspase family protein n=1 Tax=Dyadobacter sp. NIV53 TaxID=2861765 RepID=UPI001C87BAA1|nr:caspase family protein [Dyadobacter sp. NIV53]